MSESEEKWLPVAANDQVFDTGWMVNGLMIIYDTPRGVFGSIVRMRKGKWHKRLLPLLIVSPREVPRARPLKISELRTRTN